MAGSCSAWPRRLALVPRHMTQGRSPCHRLATTSPYAGDGHRPRSGRHAERHRSPPSGRRRSDFDVDGNRSARVARACQTQARLARRDAARANGRPSRIVWDVIRTSPFHERTSALNETGLWEHWSNHLAAIRYQMSDKFEYFAIRNAAGLFDSSPLYKYRIAGPDAERFLAGVLARDIRRCEPGHAQYTAWCDDRGFIVEDGVVLRLAPDEFLLTAAEPNLAYLRGARRPARRRHRGRVRRLGRAGRAGPAVARHPRDR